MRVVFLFALLIVNILCDEGTHIYHEKNLIWKREVTENNTELNLKHHKLLESFKNRWPVEKWRKFQYFTDDYLDLINEHWLQFSPPNEALQKILGGVYVLFSTVGCWGNVMVLLMYLR
ncbi:unnamed protein product [Pieris macdunnoughi]|uniref:Uncharacterized protein n=1 Tax=Pieris macdunnoughi TaxID=345717 RepID=A0A821Q5S2_9NEOP|nr:unnamed protein product [Pieris macdunnoughi]